MKLRASIEKGIMAFDRVLAGVTQVLFDERPGLLVLGLHAVFRDELEAAQGHIVPHQGLSRSRLKGLAEALLRVGYAFVGADELLAGLDPGERYALFTFDDGYYNNTLAQEVLGELGIPAIYFITSDNSEYQRCYWPDVLYRELNQRGQAPGAIHAALEEHMGMSGERANESVSALFGEGAFTPRGDIDRPFSAAELARFSRMEGVCIGNQTRSHAILPLLSAGQIEEELNASQRWIEAQTGRAPFAIAYPCGVYNEQVLKIVQERGFTLGFSIEIGKNRFPRSGHYPERLRLRRQSFSGEARLEERLRVLRSDVSLYGPIKNLLDRRRIAAMSVGEATKGGE
ncbi:MAG: polysaccharide deacetylase family protein [Planctomycetes bacterium]|nr:polysaccharide deacetylase family protein [Planctomycetota bacterium]